MTTVIRGLCHCVSRRDVSVPGEIFATIVTKTRKQDFVLPRILGTGQGTSDYVALTAVRREMRSVYRCVVGASRPDEP